MKTSLYWIWLLGGAALLYFVLDVYWALTWVGLCFAYAVLARRLFRREAAAVAAFVIAFTVICLGGGILFARLWSEAAAGIWVVLCVVFLMLFVKKIFRQLSPTLHMAEFFKDAVREAEAERGREER